MDPIRVGVAGAGPWAGILHAPMMAAGPYTTLSAVYGRRRDAATQLSQQYGAHGTDDFDDFLHGALGARTLTPPETRP